MHKLGFRGFLAVNLNPRFNNLKSRENVSCDLSSFSFTNDSFHKFTSIHLLKRHGEGPLTYGYIHWYANHVIVNDISARVPQSGSQRGGSHQVVKRKEIFYISITVLFVYYFFTKISACIPCISKQQNVSRYCMEKRLISNFLEKKRP